MKINPLELVNQCAHCGCRFDLRDPMKRDQHFVMYMNDRQKKAAVYCFQCDHVNINKRKGMFSGGGWTVSECHRLGNTQEHFLGRDSLGLLMENIRRAREVISAQQERIEMLAGDNEDLRTKLEEF